MSLDPQYLTFDYWLTRDDIVCKTDDGQVIPKQNEKGVLVYLRTCTTCGTSLTACRCATKNEGLTLVFDCDEPQIKNIQAIQDAANAAAAAAAASSKSFTVDPSYASVPEAIKAANSWLVFELAWNPETGKFNKTPYSPLTAKKTNDPATGVPFSTALTAQTNWNDPAPRFVLGFYVEPPFVVIDIDSCRDAQTGIIAEWAISIIRELDSYAEVSPSGTGVHIITTGVKPGEACKKGIEIYSTGRPLTVTGVQVPGTPNLVNERNLSSLYERMVAGEFLQHYTKTKEAEAPGCKSSSVPVQHHSGPITDKLWLLMNGHFTENATPFTVTDEGGHNSITYPSQSEAIQALCGCLAFKHEGDPEEMEAEFLTSTLYKNITKWNAPGGKWDRLGQDVIQKAVKHYEETKNLSSEDHQDIAMSVVCAPAEPAVPADVAGFDIDPVGGQRIPTFDRRTVKGI